LRPTTVFIAKPFEISYGDAMRGLRVWLDHEKIQPAAFKVAGEGRIGFEITFSTEQDALAFGRFKWLRPGIEQPAGLIQHRKAMNEQRNDS
jgi:hypothetical protein